MMCKLITNLPAQESHCHSGKEAMMETGNGSAQKASIVQRALRDRTILDHLPLVISIAARVHENLPVHVALNDLIHAGILGLFHAASTNHPRKKAVFHTYARHRIKVAILDSLRQADWASADPGHRRKPVKAATRGLSAQFEPMPSEAAIAGNLVVEVGRWPQMVAELRTAGLSRRGTEAENVAAPELPGQQEFPPDSMSAKEELREIMRAIETLPQRYQEVAVMYYTNNVTMKEIGRRLGISKSRVSRIHKEALEMMAIALQSAGAHLSAATVA